MLAIPHIANHLRANNKGLLADQCRVLLGTITKKNDSTAYIMALCVRHAGNCAPMQAAMAWQLAL
jgi:hypothetical protein